MFSTPHDEIRYFIQSVNLANHNKNGEIGSEGLAKGSGRPFAPESCADQLAKGEMAPRLLPGLAARWARVFAVREGGDGGV